MQQLILHNYDFSSYAEKVRVAMGYKGLDWASVTAPSTMPKPDLVPLTGGYRRIPVLQVGADTYCDTRLILRELERRFPTPTYYPQSSVGTANAISAWAEGQFFNPLLLFVWGTNQDVMPEQLHEDRAKMRGLPTPSAESVKRAASRNAPLMRAQLPYLENMLADGRDWICGQHFSVADLAVYHALWFITDRTQRLRHELTPFARLNAWVERLRSLGHGKPYPLPSTEALRIARDSSPAVPRESHREPEDPALGSGVVIRTTDYARDSISGVLVLLDRDEIAIRVTNTSVGEIVVHFPRIGYDMRPL